MADPTVEHDARSAAVRNPGLVPVVMLFVLGLSFGVVFALNLTARSNGVPFLSFVFWQSLGGAAILFVACAALRRLPSLRLAHLRVYGITGALNLAIPYTVLSFVAPKVPSGLLSIGLVLVPAVVYALALMIGLDRFRWIRLGGILLGLVGVLLLLVPRTSLPSPDMVPWVALGLAAPLCYAFNAVLIALLRPPAASSLGLGFGLLSASTVYMAVAMLATGEWWAFDGAFGAGHWATIGAMVNNVVSYTLIFEIIRRAGPVFFSTVNYLATLAGIGVGILAFGDSHSLWIWSALVLMFAGLFLVNFMGRGAPKGAR